MLTNIQQQMAPQSIGMLQAINPTRQAILGKIKELEDQIIKDKNRIEDLNKVLDLFPDPAQYQTYPYSQVQTGYMGPQSGFPNPQNT